MAKLTPEEFAEKQATNLKNSITYIEKGINAVTESPTKKAAANLEKMRQNYLKAIDNGKVKRGLERVTLDQWKTAILTKGLNRIGSGIDGARDKVVNFAGQLLPYQDNLKKQLDSMPSLTLEDSIARMTAWTRGMAKFAVK